MKAQPLLVLDYERQSLGCISFLLRLRGFTVTEVGTPAEALNWAIHSQRSNPPYALLAATNLPDAETVKLVRLLRSAGLDLPLLLASRECPVAQGPICEASALGEAIYFCRPESIAPAAHQLLDAITRDQRNDPAVKQESVLSAALKEA